MTIDKGDSAIEFRLDPDSGVPTYLQLVQQVEHALRLGYLQPGDQLPKVRDVVTSLTINPNTVLKAYRELEHKGLAAGRPGQGTFIQATLEQVTLPELAGLRRTLLGWLASAEQAGLDERALAGPPGREALVLELAVGLQHRVGVDGQRGDHVPDLGKLVTRLQVAKPQRVLYLLHELQVGRHPRVRVKPELDRAVPFIYCHRTRLQDSRLTRPALPPADLALFCSRAKPI